MSTKEATETPVKETTPVPTAPAKPVGISQPDTASPGFISFYRVFGRLGVMAIFASLLLGFRQDPNAPWRNYLVNLGIYSVFVVPHLLLTTAWWKRKVWNRAEGFPRERRFYVGIATGSWLLLLAVQFPLMEFELPLPGVARLIGYCGFLLCFFTFFHGITFEMIDALVGMPGTTPPYRQPSECPLFTEGPYAEVRHPMYRAMVFAAASALLIHSDLAQIFWSALICGTFMAYIPFEERQLLAAHGDEYRHYREKTPYRLFKGIW